MSWEPVTHGFTYRSGDYEARAVGDVWRVFHCGRFVFSSASPAAIHRWVASRQTLEIRGETLRQLVDDEPGSRHEWDMRPEAEARAEEQSE